MATVFLGLGSNLGQREDNIRQAILQLDDKGIHPTRVATLIETAPVGGPPQDSYMNTVMQGETTLEPTALLDVCLAIEQKLGRVRTVPNGPRTIDIDILLYDSITIDTKHLTIPHPRMWERSFVLDPLQEIAPELIKT